MACPPDRQNPAREPKSVSLPVVQTRPGPAPKMGSTRRGRWRFWVLVGVHVLMAAHLLQWAVMGSTVSPVEPSESMQTLEMGLVNAGAVLFALAILSTLVFGRFFCGWLCHVVALQDACAWLMNRAGIRPKPFRSRLLVLVPLALGFYMFIWPNFKRFVIAPALDSWGVAWPAWLRPVNPFNAWQSEMIVEDFWATFPAWYVAVPFLLVCGFATVYFLGAKGFCTYACPYGGIFRPVDRAAPLRVRVTDACTQCGHCTSVCTANVRISDEVRDFGMVVDPNCMKCLDCIEVCPNDALYLGLGKPALAARPKDKAARKKTREKAARRYDMTWPGEIAAAVLFVGVFLATRGMLDQVPMLMAGGLAAVATYLFLVAWWTLVRPNTRIYGLMLKQKGRVRPAGAAFLLGTLLLAGVVAWGGQARYTRWRADMDYARAAIPVSLVVRPEFEPGPESRRRAERSARWLEQADSPFEGGRGWRLNPEHRTRQAYFLAVLGQLEEAADALQRVVDEGNPGDGLIAQLARLRQATGATEADLIALREHALGLHPHLHAVRLELATQALEAADMDRAESYFADPEGSLADDLGYRFAEVSFRRHAGQEDRALELLRAVVPMAEADRHSPAGWLADCAGAAMRLNHPGMALDLIDRAMNAKGAHPGVFFAAAEVRATFGDGPGAVDAIDQGLSMRGGDAPASLTRAAGLLMRLGRPDRARALYQQAADRSLQPFEKSQIGEQMVKAGQGMRDRSLVEAGLAVMSQAGESSEEPMIFHDMAPMLYGLSRYGEAVAAIARAAELAPDSVVMATRAAELCAMLGDAKGADAWRAEAQAREARNAG